MPLLPSKVLLDLLGTVKPPRRLALPSTLEQQDLR
jgi:hypothetical protein